MTESVKPESSEPLTPKTHFEVAQTAKQLVDFIENKEGNLQDKRNRLRQEFDMPEIPVRPGDARDFVAKIPKDWMGRFFQIPGAGIVDELTISIPGEKYPEQVIIVNAELAEGVQEPIEEIPDGYSPPSKEVVIPLHEGEPTVSVEPGTYTNGNGIREEAKLDELTGQDLLLDLQEILAYQAQTA